MLCLPQTIHHWLLSSLKNSRKSSNQGFNLIELMITVIIAGMLAAIAIPTYVAQVDKVKYAHAKVQMNCMAKELKAYQLENGNYPADSVRNTAFQDSACFEVHQGYRTDQPDINRRNDTRIPFNSVYDYENWSFGNNQCYVAITFFGKDGLRLFTQGRQNLYPSVGFHRDGDDLVLAVDIVPQSVGECQ